MKFLGNAVVFVFLYILFMFPTYLLPYLGSNSSTLNAMGTAANAGMNPLFSYHLVSLLILIVITWFRGSFVDKKWLVIFPIMAAFFDMLPLLSIIPLVPTVMHLLAIIIGVVGTRAIEPNTGATSSV